MATQEFAGIVLALADLFTLVRIPGPGFLDQFVGDPEFDDFTGAGNAFAVKNVENGFAEGRGNLVLDDLDLGFVTNHFVTALDRADATDVEADGGVELERVAAGGGFRRAEHDADLHPDLVDEDHQRIGLS
jgi:hypothetical protein